MMRRFVLLAAVIAALAPSITGCGPSDDEAGSVSLAPVEIADQAGAVCGMLVRDQSAPRAQVIHADGERSFLCSIGDLLVYLDAPSPHGDPLQVLVEVMEPDEDPLESHLEPHPWMGAADAAYVIGIERPGIMGEPVMVYIDDETAQQVTAGTAARVVDFDGLRRWWASRESG